MFFKKSKENVRLGRKIQKLELALSMKDNLCEQKDQCFIELMSDGLRHGSSLAGKHMVERREYLKKERRKKHKK